MNIKNMETNRLYLRQRTKTMIQKWLTHSTQEQMVFLGIMDEDELKLQIEKNERILAWADRQWQLWDFVEKESGRVLGNGGFHNWLPIHEKAELGYRLYEPYRNKGYMSEAIEKIVEYGFKEMTLNRMEAFVSPDNIPSLKLVEKMGFQKEGLLRQHYKSGDKIYDSLVFSLLKSEYESI